MTHSVGLLVLLSKVVDNIDIWFNIQPIHLGFSYFEFKIGLISFKKQKFLHFHSQLANSQSGVTTNTPKDQLWVGDTEKFSVTLSHAWLILVEFTYLY